MTAQKILMAALTAFFILCTPAWSNETKLKDRASDLWLESKLFTTYALNEHLNPFEIDVDVTDGVAELSGNVDTVIDKMLAVDIARGTEGIKKVRDRIRIGFPVARKDPYGFVAHVRNASTVARVKYNLMWNKDVDGLDVHVESDNGRIVLSGTVTTEKEKTSALRAAWNTSGVTYVADSLAVEKNQAAEAEKPALDKAAEKMGDAMDAAGEAVADSWINAKVKSRLLFDKLTDGLDIDVDVKNGVVTLDGTVESKLEKDYTLKQVQGMDQVKQVIDKLKIRTSASL